MTDSPIPRGAIIGCGDIAASHVTSYAEAGVELVAVCDLDRARAERLAATASRAPAVYTDFAELLAREQVDFVTIAVPVAGHVPLTLQALAAGRHVVCEKPSALTVEENRLVVAAAQRAQRTVSFLSSRMRWGHIPLARQLIAAGKLGTIYRVDVRFARHRGRPGVDIIPHAKWFVDAQLAGGGVIMDMGQYFIDQVLHLTGWPTMTAVSATTFRGHSHRLPAEVRFDVEEHCTMLVRTREGIALSFDLAWIGHHEERSQVSILGTAGGIHLDFIQGPGHEPFVFMHDEGEQQTWLETRSRWREQVKPTTSIYRDVWARIRGSAVEVGTTPEQALAITALTQSALRSAREGREVAIAG